MRYLIILLPILYFSSCGNTKSTEESPPETKEDFVPDYEKGMETKDAFCFVIRPFDFGQGTKIYLLNICPEEGDELAIGINLSAPGEPSVNVLFDTLQSFRDEKTARDYALVNKVFDVVYIEKS